jgi:arylsulfatase A
MRFPEKIAAGQVSNVPVSSLDLLPTCCALAETRLPHRTLDGTSLLPLFAGEVMPREKPLFWTYFNSLNEAQVAMRDGNYKVLARLDGGKVPKLENITVDHKAMLANAKLTDLELYDVTQDIDESENLADVDPQLAAQMLAKLSQQYLELLNDSHLWQPVQDSSIK